MGEVACDGARAATACVFLEDSADYRRLIRIYFEFSPPARNGPIAVDPTTGMTTLADDASESAPCLLR